MPMPISACHHIDVDYAAGINVSCSISIFHGQETPSSDLTVLNQALFLVLNS